MKEQYEELMKDKVSLDDKGEWDKEREGQKEILKKEQEQLYAELTEKFTKNQFRLLNELIDTEIELEEFCNQ